MYNQSIFLFTRDFRLTDNTALIEALKNSAKVICIFIFNSRQLTANPYKSSKLVNFMIESLADLSKKVKLSFFYGLPEVIIQKLCLDHEIDAIYFNTDYTPFAEERRQKIFSKIKHMSIDLIDFEDHLLNPIDKIKNSSGNPYLKFTPYWTAARKYKVDKPISNKYRNYYNKIIKNKYSTTLNEMSKFAQTNPYYKGGRDQALKMLNKLPTNYNKTHDMLELQTTNLSAYIKFGCISIREAYYKFKSVGSALVGSALTRQLYWRDFYYNIGYYNQYVLNGKNRNMKQKYNKVKWIRYETATKSQLELWKKWQAGETGIPIVDAGIKELLETGLMHNRARLIVASYLVKTIGWHWEDGEKFFAQHLIDYDPYVNNGNWQWVAGSGSDSQPYFRVFNPIRQMLKYDPKAKYIKKYIPKLAKYTMKELVAYADENQIVDYEKSTKATIDKYRKVI